MARQGRSYSTSQAQAIRKAQIKHVRSNSGSSLHHANGGNTTGASGTLQRATVVNSVAVTDSDHEMAVIGSTDTTDDPKDDGGSLSWWGKLVVRRKTGVEHHV
jgi:hypothetical protein